MPAAPTAYGIKAGKIQEIDPDEADYELPHMAATLDSHINLIPMQNAVQAPRLFYGARFYNQALALQNRETPLVQSLIPGDPDGRTFDEHFGPMVGALHSKYQGKVDAVDSDSITLKTPEGKKRIPLYFHHSYNRKSAMHQTPEVQVGDEVTPGHLLASSNYTDKKGALALGLNARVGFVPYKGWSMDDAVVISQAFADRLKSEKQLTHEQEFDDDTKGGLHHFVSLFPTAFEKSKLVNMDEHGVIRKGSIIKEGDPLILATAPKVVTARDAQVGKLSRTLQQTRRNATQLWDHQDTGEVMDVARTSKGVKVVVRSISPTRVGDKIVTRNGQKDIVSRIIPDEHMPRTLDGEPLEVLMNPLSVPSRVNNNFIYETLLGKVARKSGQPYRLNGFNGPGEKYHEFVEAELAKHGLQSTDEVFDPQSNRKLQRPITTGVAHFFKLHHEAASKSSARGISGYDSSQQPSRGAGDSAQSKRLSGLEVGSLLSSGAYANLKEASTLRGQQNDQYWREVRMGHKPPMPGEPFVWHKFKVLLNGAGLHAKDIGGGKLRLGAFTDKALAAHEPKEIAHGGTVNLATLEEEPGGLFDPSLIGNNRWGKISLHQPLPSPAFEGSIRTILGLTKAEFEDVLAGKRNLD